MAIAKRVTRAAAKASKRKRAASGGTFIQRSRRISSEQKAMYHQVTGAGRSRVLRPFLGLTTTEALTAQQALEQQIAKRLEAFNR